MDPRYSVPPKLTRKISTKYLNTKVQVADRLELLLITYDEVIRAADRKDVAQIKRAVNLLINTLDLDHATEFGIGMIRLYKFSIMSADKGDFEAVTTIFTQLSDAWRILQDSQRRKGK
jgi:flagellin-specific chaperone FliS